MIWFVTEKFHFVKRKIFIEEDIRFFRVSFFVSSAFVNLTRAFLLIYERLLQKNLRKTNIKQHIHRKMVLNDTPQFK